MRPAIAIVVVVAAIVCAATASAAQDTAPAPTAANATQEQDAPPAASPRQWPPMYNDRRFEENWRPIDWSDPHRGSRDVFDPIKAVKLNDSGSLWVGFGGQFRGRMVRQSTIYFGGPGDFEPTMWTWRGKLYTDIHFGEKLRVFGEYGYSYTEIDEFRLGSIPPAPNLNGDAINAFAEFSSGVGKGWRGGLRGGRRELQMGHERVLSPGNWLLNQHTFDGGGGWLENGTIHAHSTTIEFGYRLPTVRFMPRPFVSFNYANGDDDPTDSTLGTFDPLYPLA